MAWATPKTNWAASDGVSTTDMNRIEQNAVELKKAATIAIVDAGSLITATDVENALQEIATDVKTGRTSVASSITAMGQSAVGTDSMATLATKIRNISKDSTATAAQILNGYTAYVNGVKTTGTQPNKVGIAVDSVGRSADGAGNLWLNPQAGYYDNTSSVHILDSSFVPGNIALGSTVLGVAGAAARKEAAGTIISIKDIFPGFIYGGNGYSYLRAAWSGDGQYLYTWGGSGSYYLYCLPITLNGNGNSYSMWNTSFGLNGVPGKTSKGIPGTTDAIFLSQDGQIRRFTTVSASYVVWAQSSADATANSSGGIAVDTSGTYVYHGNYKTVLKRNCSDGALVTTFGPWAPVAQVLGVAVDASGNIYVADALPRIQKFNSAGVLQWSFTTISSSANFGWCITLSPDGTLLYYTDGTSLKSIRTSDAGAVASVTMSSSSVSNLECDGAGNVVVLNTYSNMFKYTANLVAVSNFSYAQMGSFNSSMNVADYCPATYTFLCAGPNNGNQNFGRVMTCAKRD